MPSQKEIFAAQKAAKELAKVRAQEAAKAAQIAAVKTAEIEAENKRWERRLAKSYAKSISVWEAHNMETGYVVSEAQVADEIRYKNI